jgi:multiple sugar transport system substrate-binding protein
MHGGENVRSRTGLIYPNGRASRRKLLQGAGALGLAAGLGVPRWSSGRALAQETRFGALSKEWEGTTLNVSLVAEPRSDAIQALAPEFTEATGITVNFNILPYPNLEEQQLTALSQQTGEQDLVHVDCVWMGQYAGQGWLHPVEEFVAETDPSVLDLQDFMPRVLEEQSMWDGALYGLPFINAIFALYYRTDIFEELSLEPPKTWEELAIVAQTIHEAKSGEGVAGLTMMGRRGVQLVCTHLNVFGSMGGYYYDENYQPTMGSEAGVNSIEYLKSLLPWSVEGALSNDYDETAAAFQQGLAAMNLQWQNAAPQFVDPEASKIVGKWDIVEVPGVDEGGVINNTPTFGGWNLGISADSQNKEAAWEFLVWATSKPIEVALAPSGPGARRSTLENPELQKTYIEYPMMLESLETALGRPRIPVWPQMNDAIAASLSEVMVGQTPAQDAMMALDGQLADILLGGGYGG